MAQSRRIPKLPLPGLPLVLGSALVLAQPGLGSNAFDPEKVGFTIQVKDIENPYRILASSVAPEEALPLQAKAKAPNARFTVQVPAGRLIPLGDRKWTWQAPARPGLYPVTITEEKTRQTMTLNLFVLARADEKVEAAPAGFIEVTKRNQDEWVSPHFQLKQFLCKEAGAYPKRLKLQPRLLLKLETLLERVNAAGIPTNGFHVMSGFRSPAYNRAIGNTTTRSRHLAGDAADIFIDRDGDGRMDDLNGDGRIDDRDAKVIYDLVDGMDADPACTPLAGGLCMYKATPSHGPMVHVDARGKPTRW